MTNREWLLNKMQSMSDEELAKYLMVTDEIEEENDCQGTMCADGDCAPCVIKWLKQKYIKKSPKLSEAERVILKNIDKDYKWIARDKDTKLFIYRNKPIKGTVFAEWLVDGGTENKSIVRPLFQFITWKDNEPYNIEELLKGE